MYNNILFQTSAGGITTITLNRPEVYNSLNEETCLELLGALNLCKGENTKVVVLTGNGKGFCSGQDIKQLIEQPNIKPSDIIRKTYNPLILAMRRLGKTIICKLNGVAAGAGCSLALACDMIIASEESFLSEAFIGIGLVPDSGSSYFITKLVSRNKVFELLALGNKISAVEGQKIGIINTVVPANILDKTVEEWAEKISNSPLKAIELIKNMLHNIDTKTLEEVLEMEAQMQDIAADTQDFKEGVKAFKEKRKPNFKGH